MGWSVQLAHVVGGACPPELDSADSDDGGCGLQPQCTPKYLGRPFHTRKNLDGESFGWTSAGEMMYLVGVGLAGGFPPPSEPMGYVICTDQRALFAHIAGQICDCASKHMSCLI